MTRPRVVLSVLLGAALTPSAAIAGAIPEPAADPVQAAPDQVGELHIPDDARYYSDLAAMFQLTPSLGASGAFEWFYSRQRAVDDPRALGVAAFDPAAGPAVALASIAKTTALRSFGERSSPGGASLEAWRGDALLADARTTPRPARVAAVALRDGRGGRVLGRYVKGLEQVRLVASDAGFWTIGSIRSRGRSSAWQAAVLRPGTTKPVIIKQLSGAYGAAPLSGGKLLVVGQSTSNALPDPVFVVDRRGQLIRRADRRKPGATFATGRTGVVPGLGGIVLSEGSGQYGPSEIDKEAILVRSASTGKVLRSARAAELGFPRPEACNGADYRTKIMRLTATSDGSVAATIACAVMEPSNSGDRTVHWKAAVMVGLRPDLTVGWWRPAPEVAEAWYGDPRVCGSAKTGSDGRLFVIDCATTNSYSVAAVRAISIPGAPAPRYGKLGSVKRSGKSGALVRINCGGDAGKVCSGTVTVTAGGHPVGSAKYALPARPGAARGELDRYVPITGGGKGKLRATLTAIAGA